MLVLVALFASGTDASATSVKAYGSRIIECGHLDEGVGVKNLTTRKVSCRRARRIVRAYDRDRTPYGFGCRERETGRPYETDIRCTRGAQVVRWQYVTD